MGYRNSPVYVQRIIDGIIRPHREYCRAYVDDLVIFSKSLDEHLKHLRLIFQELRERNICLSAKKSFLGYPSVQLLGQKVDVLKVATSRDKLRAIALLKFPESLKQLETYLGMTGYLRHARILAN